MFSNSKLIPVFVLSAVVASCEIARSDQEGEIEEARVEEATLLTTEFAKKYVMTLADGSNAKCDLLPRSILKWSNPVAGSIHGNVFLWTHEKRPVAVGSFYQWFSPWTHMSHEFHLLAETTIAATYRDVDIWNPTMNGVRFTTLRNAMKPRETPAARLIQMRRIVREFSSTKTLEENGKRQQRQMRLLTQPIYRYSSGKIIDGAIFVFVQGTDPEVWLLLEAYESAESVSVWRYATARMNTTEFKLRRDGESVWQVEAIPHRDTGNSSSPYFKINADDLPQE